ncbi:MAG: hypothetical protein ABIH23_10825 [bacterium]
MSPQNPYGRSPEELTALISQMEKALASEKLNPAQTKSVTNLISQFKRFAPDVEPLAPEKGFTDRVVDTSRNLVLGGLKGAGSTAMGLGMLARKVPGVKQVGDALSEALYGSSPTFAGEEEPGAAPGITHEQAAQKLGIRPEGMAQKIGYGTEQIAEFFVPAGNIARGVKFLGAGAKVAKWAPKLKKTATVAEYMTRGALEAVPAVTVAKAQGIEDAGAVAFFAMAGPSFGKILNKTKVSEGATAAAKGIVGKVSETIASKIPEVPLSPRQMMYKALKPYVRNRDFDHALDVGMPVLFQRARELGIKITNVDEFMTVLKNTKKEIWKPYTEFLKRYGADTIDGNKVADDILNSVAPRQRAMKTRLNAEGREELVGSVKAVHEWANKLRKPMSLDDVETSLQNVNAEIQSYYNLYPRMRHAALEAKPRVASAVAEAEAYRKLVAEMIDSVDEIAVQAGEKPLNIRHLKDVYGGLLNLEQEGYRRLNVAKRLAPESLTEQMANVRAMGEFMEVAMAGRPITALLHLAKGTAYKQAGKIIKERNTSDYLIRKAFQDFGDYVEGAKLLHRLPAVGVAMQGTP